MNSNLERLDQTVFLRRCRNSEASRAELNIFLVQQFHYSRHFTRYLCALLSNMVDEDDRRVLTENLFEEMGLGGVGDEPHAKIYRDMLHALGLSPVLNPPLPATTALAATMLHLCSNPDPMVGLGALCLGAEAIVPHVYRQILTGLLAAGFPEKHLRFFPLHIEGDDDHALTMKAILDRELQADPGRKETVMAAAAECVEKRAIFFEAISVAAIKEGRAIHAV